MTFDLICGVLIGGAIGSCAGVVFTSLFAAGKLADMKDAWNGAVKCDKCGYIFHAVERDLKNEIELA